MCYMPTYEPCGLSQQEPAPKKSAASETASTIMRQAPVRLHDDGEVAHDPPEAAHDLPAPELVQAYDIVETSKAMDLSLSDTIGFTLFQKYAECQLLNAHIFHSNVAQRLIAVEIVEAAEPMVWLARAKAAVPPGGIVLIPWVASLVRLAPDAVRDSDAITEASIKRPKHFHGGLPLFAKLTIECKTLDDIVHLAARSPLPTLSTSAACPSAFWCVLEAGEGDDERVNMKMETAHMSFPAVQAEISGKPACRKKKSPMIDLSIPVLINSKPLKEGQALIRERCSQLEIAACPKVNDEEEQPKT